MISKTLSVIIPVSKDLRIARCLKSIDVQAEIIVVLNNNPTVTVRKIVETDPRCRVVMVRESGCNLARVLNIGITQASCDKIVIMNSDCYFPAGLLGQIEQQLEIYQVVKAQVEFAFRNWREKLVAQNRRLFHQILDGGRKLFGPGLAFRKAIIDQIGGHYFDEQMGWGEDGEMSARIRQSPLTIQTLEEKIRHEPEGVWHDWRIAFRIGQGNGTKAGITWRHLWRELWTDVRHFLTDHHQQFRTARQEGGWLLWTYFLSWKLFFHLGYYSKIIKREGEKNG